MRMYYKRRNKAGRNKALPTPSISPLGLRVLSDITSGIKSYDFATKFVTDVRNELVIWRTEFSKGSINWQRVTHPVALSLPGLEIGVPFLGDGK